MMALAHVFSLVSVGLGLESSSRFSECAGSYLYDTLFARMGLNGENVFMMLALLEDAQTLLSDVALEAGRRWDAPKSQVYSVVQHDRSRATVFTRLRVTRGWMDTCNLEGSMGHCSTNVSGLMKNTSRLTLCRCGLCRSASTVTSSKLGLLTSAVKLAFGANSLEDTAATAGVPDTSAYRVHIHMERPKVCLLKSGIVSTFLPSCPATVAMV